MFLAALLSFAFISAVFADNTKHGHWTLQETLASPTQIHLLFALKQQNVEKLSQIVRQVSDPDSIHYTNYLSRQELTSLIQPSAETQRVVFEWLAQHGASSKEHWVQHQDVVKATFPITIAEKLFNVDLRVWRGDNGRFILRSQKVYSMPEELKNHVDLIHGLSDFPLARSKNALVSKNIPLNAQYERVEKFNSNLNVKGPGVTPIISLVDARGSPPRFNIKLEMRCPDGVLPTTFPLCNDRVVSMQAFADIIGGSPIQSPILTFNAQYDGCTLGKTSTDAISCTIDLPVDYYLPAVNVTVATNYQSGVMQLSTSEFMAVATPPVLPQTLKAQYGIPQHLLVTTNVTQSVAEFEQQYYSDKDLRQFFHAVGMDESYADLVDVIGPNNQTQPGGEANLDIQYIMGVAPNASTTFWSIKAVSAIEIDDILKWAYAVGNATSPPLVTSISYGMSENQVDAYLGKGYLQRSDVEFQKLAALGLTVIIASGDTGAGDLGPPPMSNPNCTTLHPDWPSQSPYITSIGSTYFTPLAEPTCYGTVDCTRNPLGEVGVSMDNGLFWTTGGGFSNITSTAWFQTSAVSQYLKSGVAFPPMNVWNKGGRAYPDAVACGHNLMVVLNGRLIPVDGTSASAPIFAGVITLLNDQRARVGKKPLGFINPLLYKIATSRPAAFYDVTVGNNRCGAYPGGDFPAAQTCCPWGFEATANFDAVAGLGSPYYPDLLAAVMALP